MIHKQIEYQGTSQALFDPPTYTHRHKPIGKEFNKFSNKQISPSVTENAQVSFAVSEEKWNLWQTFVFGDTSFNDCIGT